MLSQAMLPRQQYFGFLLLIPMQPASGLQVIGGLKATEEAWASPIPLAHMFQS